MRTYCQECGFASEYVNGVKPLSCESCGELFTKPPTRPKPHAKASVKSSVPSPAKQHPMHRRWQDEDEPSDFDYSLDDLDLSGGLIKGTGTTQPKWLTLGEAVKDQDISFERPTQQRGGRVADTQPAEGEDSNKSLAQIKNEVIQKMLKPDVR